MEGKENAKKQSLTHPDIEHHINVHSLSFNSLPQSRLSTTLKMKPFENIVGKGKNAGNQHFLVHSVPKSLVTNKCLLTVSSNVLRVIFIIIFFFFGIDSLSKLRLLMIEYSDF